MNSPAESVIQQGSTVNTDEYSIYARLPAWGYVHVTVNHSEGEYARDAGGDGVNEVHVNTMEGIWSLVRSCVFRSYAAGDSNLKRQPILAVCAALICRKAAPPGTRDSTVILKDDQEACCHAKYPGSPPTQARSQTQ